MTDRGELMKLIRIFVILAGALTAYALEDAALSALVHADGSDHSWQAVSAFGALGGAGVAVIVALGAIARLTLADGRSERRRVQKVRHLDYALIAEIEREVYGEAFHHDGAPEVERVRGDWSPLDSVDPQHCGICENRYRMQELGRRRGTGSTNTIHFAGSSGMAATGGGGGGTGTASVHCGTCKHAIDHCTCSREEA